MKCHTHKYTKETTVFVFQLKIKFKVILISGRDFLEENFYYSKIKIKNTNLRTTKSLTPIFNLITILCRIYHFFI